LVWSLHASLARLLEQQGLRAEANAQYEQAARTIDQIASAIGDEGLRCCFTQSPAVSAVQDSLKRLSQ
jgi:hypothetical protein